MSRPDPLNLFLLILVCQISQKVYSLHFNESCLWTSWNSLLWERILHCVSFFTGQRRRKANVMVDKVSFQLIEVETEVSETVRSTPNELWAVLRATFSRCSLSMSTGRTFSDLSQPERRPVPGLCYQGSPAMPSYTAFRQAILFSFWLDFLWAVNARKAVISHSAKFLL